MEASIRQTLGSIYTELGDYAKAVGHYEVALRHQRERLGADNPETLRSLRGLAMAYWWSGDMPRAEPLTCLGLETSRRMLGETNLLTLQFMQARAFTLLYLGEVPWNEVEALFLRALVKHREILGPDDPAILRLIYGIGLGYSVNIQDQKAAPLLEDALENAPRLLDEKHPYTADLASMLTSVCSRLEQVAKAEELARRAMEMRRRTLGEDHSKTINSAVILARIYVQQGRREEARALTDQTIQAARKLLVENSPFLAMNLSTLGWQYLEEGDVAQADFLCSMALDALRRKPNANPVSYLSVLAQTGAVRLAQRRWTEAEALLRETTQRAERFWPESGYRFHLLSPA